MKRTLLGFTAAAVLALVAGGCGSFAGVYPTHAAPDLFEPDFGVSEPRAARGANGYEWRSRPWTSYDETR